MSAWRYFWCSLHITLTSYSLHFTLHNLVLLNQNRRSTASSIADTGESKLSRVQIVHHVSNDPRPRHPRNRHIIHSANQSMSMWRSIKEMFLKLPDWMSEGNRSSVDIDFIGVDVQHLDVGQNDDAECFIDLPHGDVFFLYAGGLQDLQTLIR